MFHINLSESTSNESFDTGYETSDSTLTVTS